MAPRSFVMPLCVTALHISSLQWARLPLVLPLRPTPVPPWETEELLSQFSPWKPNGNCSHRLSIPIETGQELLSTRMETYKELL